MFFYISTNGQMTLNAFKAWLMTDEAVQHLEGLMPSWVLEGWMRADDSLKRRGRICKRCISIAKDDERVKRCIVFRGDAGDAGCPGYSNLRIEEPQYQVSVEGTEFGRLVHDLPQVDVCQDDDPGFNPDKSEERRIVRELFRGFVEKIRMFREQEPSADYSSAMLYLESLSCAFPKTKKDERWFVISCLSNDGPHNDDKQRNFLPCAYKTEKKAREALKHLAEHVVPRNWERYKIVVDDRVATIAQLVRPIQGGNAERQKEIKLQVEREPILVPKDRLIPIGNPLVRNWVVARAKNWETRDYTMEEWLRKLNPMNCEGSSGAEKAVASERYADKCDWWKFDFDRLGNEDWVLVLRHRPDLMDKCPCVNEFLDSEWCLLLRRQPQFADRFDRWDTLPLYLWCSLLRRQPQFAERFNQWDELSSDLWCFLLRRQPRFAERFNGWGEFYEGHWVLLLKDQPQFSDRCPWGNLSGYSWCELLCVRPEFEGKCDWSKLDGDTWVDLLSRRPEFSEHCEWVKLNGHDWAMLLEVLPEFFEQCDTEKLDIDDWWRVLYAHPCLACHFTKWEQLSKAQLLRLLKISAEFCAFVNFAAKSLATRIDYLLLRPEFANEMVWSDVVEPFDWYRLIAARPEYAQYAPADVVPPSAQSYVWLGKSGPVVVIPLNDMIKDKPQPFVDRSERVGNYHYDSVWPDYTCSVQYKGSHHCEDHMSHEAASSVVSHILNAKAGEKAIAIDGVYVGDEGNGVKNFAEILKEWFRSNDTTIQVMYLEYGYYYSREMLND